MVERTPFWLRFLDVPLSRRDALRRAALGVAGLALARGGALAQGASPATPAPAPQVLGAADYLRRLPELTAAVIPAGVTARRGNQQAWPALRGVSIAQVEIPAGAWRSIHLHTNTAELAVVLEGQARAGLQTPEKEWLEMDLTVGDAVYFPVGWSHWFRNTGEGTLRAYFNYGHEQPITVEVAG